MIATEVNIGNPANLDGFDSFYISMDVGSPYRLLLEKGIISREEFFERVKVVDQEMKR